jgi:hypothetical protein
MTDVFNFPDLTIHLGLPENFFRELADEDDWTFIIKLHALFEGVCSHLLTYHFKEPSLSKIISMLELSNKSTGKLAFLSALDLIQDDHRRLLYKLSEIRNSLVHDIRKSKFSLQEMVSSMNEEQLTQFALTFSPWESLSRKFHNMGAIKYENDHLNLISIEHVVKRAKEKPKEHIYYGAFDTLSSLLEKYSYSEYLNDIKK